MCLCSSNEQIFNICLWFNFHSFNTLSLVVPYRWTELDQSGITDRYTISDNHCI